MVPVLRAVRRSDRGFSAIELQIVLMVLGGLSVVGFSAASGIHEQGMVAACQVDVATVEVASVAYQSDHGTYADAIDDVAHSPSTLVGAGYLAAAPGDARYTVTYDPADGTARGTVGATGCGGRHVAG